MRFHEIQYITDAEIYLEKQKSFTLKKKYLLSRTAKIDPKDDVSHPNFQ